MKLWSFFNREPLHAQELRLCLPSACTNFNDAAWNSRSVRTKVNGLAYALDRADMGAPNPGQLKDARITPFPENADKDTLRDLLKHDGLIALSETDALKTEGHIIAAFLNPARTTDAVFGKGKIKIPADYHILRQDSDRLWSHKNGYGPVSRAASGGGMIITPHTANFPRLEFAGYFKVPAQGIKYLSRIDTPPGLRPALSPAA